MCRAMLAALLVVTACAPTTPLVPYAQPTACPDVKGRYVEAGTESKNGEMSKSVAHLSWVIPPQKQRAAERPIVTPPNRGPTRYYVHSYRIWHPDPGHLAMEALDQDGQKIADFVLGPEDGLTCGDGAFIWRHDGDIGGEGDYGGDSVDIQTLRRSSDGSLVRTVSQTWQSRSLLLLGARVGSADGYTFEQRFAVMRDEP
jgi:hypothetical protein